MGHSIVIICAHRTCEDYCALVYVLTAFVPQLSSSRSIWSRNVPADDSDSEREVTEEQEDLDGEGIVLGNPHNIPSSANHVERDSAESLAFHDPTHVQLTLQMLGLMCDGQNHTLQVRILQFDSNLLALSIRI